MCYIFPAFFAYNKYAHTHTCHFGVIIIIIIIIIIIGTYYDICYIIIDNFACNVEWTETCTECRCMLQSRWQGEVLSL